MATGKAEILSWTYVETAPGTDITQYITLWTVGAEELRHGHQVCTGRHEGRAVRQHQ